MILYGDFIRCGVALMKTEVLNVMRHEKNKFVFKLKMLVVMSLLLFVRHPRRHEKGQVSPAAPSSAQSKPAHPICAKTNSPIKHPSSEFSERK